MSTAVNDKSEIYRMMKIIGHRGGRNLWPENSLGGFRNVLTLGVDAVELDVHLSSDGVPVVIHDPLLDRTTNGRGPVQAQSAEALGKIVLKDSRGETVPTLAAVLDIFAATSLELELEIKTDERGFPYPDMPEKIIALVQERGMLDRVFLTCFVPEILEDVRRKLPAQRLLMPIDRRSAEFFGGFNKVLRRGIDVANVVAIEKSLLEEVIDQCVAEAGTSRVGCWVPNTETELEYWMSKPIGQLTTDRPDLALLVAGRQSPVAMQQKG
ncbi:glycerophosphodiester phosphodiesterase family protein [Microvirga sp. M2]|uniref:glycerophosphodiester phosphodiesterase family protein n=1 Tax=Microvirga sp. M2 TaxID=3073270 RepID=UPI0039C33B8B